MVQAAIEANFTCSCGEPLVVLTLDQAPGDKVSALVLCPKHRVGHHVLLDHSALDLWAYVVADRLFRCALCGHQLPPVTAASSTEAATTFTLVCPTHGTQNNTRTVWSVLYHRLLAEAQQRHGVKPTTTPTPTSPKSVTIPQESTTAKQSPPPSALQTPPIPTFCPECGKRIRPNDEFCYRCGARIED